MKESDLVDIANKQLERFGCTFTNEAPMGIGIPDIMSGSSLRDDFIALDDFRALELHQFLRKKRNAVPYQSIVSSYPLGQKLTRHFLKILVEKQLIQVEGSRVSALTSISSIQKERIHSIEVKVRDWKNGLLQATRYKMFSDYSYLAISERFSKNVDLEQLKHLGIGLLEISEQGIQLKQKAYRSKKVHPQLKYIAVSWLKNRTATINTKPVCFLEALKNT